jgi:hypothetical protein
MALLAVRTSTRWMVLSTILVLAFAITLVLHPIPQPPWYHHFADSRTMLGVPNALDVLSNLAFIAVGLAGLYVTLRNTTQTSHQRWALATLFLGLLLTGFGSGYYHLAPDNQRLLWDRLPMTIAMGGILSLLLVNRLPDPSPWILPVLTAVGMASALQWAWSEQQGRGDLRWYGLYQGLIFITGFALVVMFPRVRPEGTRAVVIAFLANVAAKIFESLDKPIFSLGQIMSGHTLKHLAAGLGFIPLVMWVAAQKSEEVEDSSVGVGLGRK